MIFVTDSGGGLKIYDPLNVQFATPQDVNIASPLDTTTGAVETIDYAHHEVHSGRMFSCFVDHGDLAGGANLDILIVTANTLRQPHMGFTLGTEKETTVNFYEGTTYSAAGAAVTPMNHNRRNVIAPETAITTGPTVTLAGTLLTHSFRMGSGKNDGGAAGTALETILAQNQAYLMRIFNATSPPSAGWISWGLFWYEHLP